MSATRLSLYNDALLLAGERAITGLTVTEETRRLLDQIWNNQGVDACLEEGQWMFAMRTIRVDYNPSYTPDYGYSRVFDKPTDWILTSAVCSDEYFRSPILRYVDEAGFWYSDIDSIYVRYVSNDASYGSDMAKWPPSFKDFVAAHFATQLLLKITNDEKRLALFVNPARPLHSIRGRALLKAKSRCAMAGPTSFEAQGKWSLSRTRGSNTRDGGNTSGNLIG
jgi:hypothetical protein